MEKVSIIDIQGEQWAITDQETNERLDKLETKTNIKKTRLWESGNSYFELIEINDIKYYNAFFEAEPKVSKIGQTLFNIPPVGQTKEFNRAIISANKVDGSGRLPVIIEITRTGYVKAIAIFDDKISGVHPEIILYGQFYIMMD